MRFTCPLIVVDDIERSRQFYEGLMGQEVMFDFGANITFHGGFSLQSKSSWADFIDMKENEILSRSLNFELYFEEEDFDGFINRLSNVNVILVHDVRHYPWGQRVIRFYDPDQHVIEVGESMADVVRRFLAAGLSLEETAHRTQHPLDFVKSCVP